MVLMIVGVLLMLIVGRVAPEWIDRFDQAHPGASLVTAGYVLTLFILGSLFGEVIGKAGAPQPSRLEMLSVADEDWVRSYAIYRWTVLLILIALWLCGRWLLAWADDLSGAGLIPYGVAIAVLIGFGIVDRSRWNSLRAVWLEQQASQAGGAQADRTAGSGETDEHWI